MCFLVLVCGVHRLPACLGTRYDGTNEQKELSVLEAAYLLGQNDQARVEFLSGRVLPVYSTNCREVLKLVRWVERKWHVHVYVNNLVSVRGNQEYELYHLTVARKLDSTEERGTPEQ